MTMFSTLQPILTAYLIMFADTLLGQLSDSEIPKCRQQETYAISSQISQPLTITLYYQAGRKLEPDIGYLKAMCIAISTFSQVGFIFIVGQGVKEGKKGPECINKDKNNKDCTFNYEHACASQLVDFNAWVCCTVNGGSGRDCIASQDQTKVEEFNQCVQLEDPKIKPDEILLNNAAKANQIENPSGCVPLLLFNGNLEDMCARFMFYEDPKKVINAILNKK